MPNVRHILRAVAGPQRGEVLVLGTRATLGRAADCDIQILHHGASRHHAKLALADDAIVLTDLSSDNGTFVNGERVDQRVLAPGDAVTVMDCEFLYETIEAQRAVASSTAYQSKVTSTDSLRRTAPVPSTGRPGATAGGARQSRGDMPAARAVRPDAEPAYRAGTSGSWRRSVLPATRGASPMAQPDGAVDLPPLDASESASRLRPPPFGRASTAPLRQWERGTPGGEMPVAEPPPVTSGSGAFRRPRPPLSTRAAEVRMGRPVTGRYGSDEVGPALVSPYDAFAPAARLVPRAARGGSALVLGNESAVPSAKVPPGRAQVAFETGEYPAPGAPTTGEYGAMVDEDLDKDLDDDLDEDRDDEAGDDQATVQALTADLVHRSLGGAPGGAPDPDGRFALAAVLQYRDFRLRSLQGDRLSSVEQRHYEHLDQYLQRTVPEDDALAAMRRFTRFTCELPAELTHADTRGMSTLAVAIYDIGAGGAKLDVGTTDLNVGDVAWLAIELEGVPEVPVAGASKVLFKSRVVWVGNAQLGLSFAGAPMYDVPAGH